MTGFLFTFHYGSILISSKRLTSLTYDKFTFHYGSILIGKWETIKCKGKIFTFHYGSILIQSQCSKDIFQIYLHSTMVLF